jgi:hypothetical protein
MKNLLLISLASVLLFLGCSKDSTSPKSADSSSTGQGGSMAAMTIVGDYIYRIAAGTNLEIYNISKDSTAVILSSINIGTGVETVFPFKNYLLFGTQNGMLIYEISNPESPAYVSTYEHVVSCDPVVAQGNYAYVTLRNGNRCNRGRNQLEVIDISDIANPTLVSTFAMVNPHGLSVDGKQMVVGEGDYGFKSFDLSDPENPVQKDFENKVPGFDIISQGSTFILVGAKGLYQYKYTTGKPELLSFIPISTP